MLLFFTFFPQFPPEFFSTFFHPFHTLFSHYPYPHSRFSIFCGISFSFLKIKLQQLINIPSESSYFSSS
jgi:hypothetical protein